MARITSTVLAVLCIIGGSYGMECSLTKSDNIIEKLTKTCPPPFSIGSNLEYCCISLKDESFYCCDAEEFAVKTGLGIIVPAIIAVVIIISLVVLCISCLCCTCCPWYRRRHRGTVYGNLHPHSTAPPEYLVHQQIHQQTVHQQPMIYATNTSAMPHYPVAVSQPPQYVQEGYLKQSPYNPGYVQ